jgi:hypothetical protein
MKILTIDDSNNNYLSFDLRDIIEEIPNGFELTWKLTDISISFIEATRKLTQATDQDFTQIETIMDSTEPHLIEWSELKRLSALNIQTIDGKFIAENETEKIEIIAFDSSYWQITTTNEMFINRLISRFNSVTIKT